MQIIIGGEAVFVHLRKWRGIPGMPGLSGVLGMPDGGKDVLWPISHPIKQLNYDLEISIAL